MEIFLDTADVGVIEKYKDFIDGVTTNPSLLVAEKVNDVEDVVFRICNIVSGPVSVEVISSEFDAILDEGERLSKIHPRVCVKLPCTFDGLRACRSFSERGIATNVTLCFSPTQALLAAKCGATYVSPFIGRVDDIGCDGLNLIEEIVDIFDIHGFETRVLAASVRNISHFAQAVRAGTDAVTLPVKILEQVFSHPLTNLGLEKFKTDWAKRK